MGLQLELVSNIASLSFLDLAGARGWLHVIQKGEF
jgi:hypothetical protein